MEAQAVFKPVKNSPNTALDGMYEVEKSVSFKLLKGFTTRWQHASGS